MSIKDQAKKKMQAAVDHLNAELKSIRTGRANPAIVDPIMVEVYGTQMRLKDLAAISAPEPRQLLITPFDASNTPSIGQAIEKANLGLQPIIDANAVRLNVPPMDENVRKEMVKQCNKKKEEGKVSVRNIRRDSKEVLKKMKSSGELSEDDVKRFEKELQDLTDQFCKDIDERVLEKEKEVMTV